MKINQRFIARTDYITLDDDYEINIYPQLKVDEEAVYQYDQNGVDVIGWIIKEKYK
jgi:hypothetical protein